MRRSEFDLLSLQEFRSSKFGEGEYNQEQGDSTSFYTIMLDGFLCFLVYFLMSNCYTIFSLHFSYVFFPCRQARVEDVHTKILIHLMQV